ncbi:MAG TPA: DUF2939 domain-containing protein [Beijerinckiaceae bacterium]|jgi:hypothetical protein
MRWVARSFLALIVFWAAYIASPFVALYRFAKAVEAKDLAAIEARVNFRALRTSLTSQLITEYLIATGREGELKGSRRQAAVGIGTTIADPLIAQYLTPVALASFLEDPRVTGGAAQPTAAPAINLDSLSDAWRVFITAETRGFRAITIGVPVDRPADEQFRFQLRLTGMTWRLVGLTLPKPILQRLVQELIKNNPTAM